MSGPTVAYVEFQLNLVYRREQPISPLLQWYRPVLKMT